VCEDALISSLQNVYYCKATNETPMVYTTAEGITEKISTLIDSGSSRNFIDLKFAKENNIPLTKLQSPRSIETIDGKTQKDQIQFRCKLKFDLEGRTFCQKFYVMNAMVEGDQP
jgi:hypothetical protein